jgi:hypothetical protein
MARIHPDQLRDERLIIWVEDILHAPYVRELLAPAVANRAWWPAQADCPGEVVGFGALCADAPRNGTPGRFARRLFWLAEDDRDAHRSGRWRDGQLPRDAVDPRSVIPRVPGRHPADDRTDPIMRGYAPLAARPSRTRRTSTIWEVRERSVAGIEIAKVTRQPRNSGRGRLLRCRRFLFRDNCIFALRSRPRRNVYCTGPELLSNFYLTFHRNEVVGLVDGECVPPVSGVIYVNCRGTTVEFPFQMSLNDLHSNGRLVRQLGAHAGGYLIFANRDAGLIRDISLRLADWDL